MIKSLKEKLKCLLKDYPYITRFLIYYKLYFKMRTKYMLKKMKFVCKKVLNNDNAPRVLQFPITYKCNLDCVMCGMQKMKNKEDLSVDNLSHILSNKLFSQITSVGVNGGEPFVIPNIDEFIRVLIKNLPNLKNIYIITNGYQSERILNKLKVIKTVCIDSNVKLTVSISLDGIGLIHDRIRGRDNIFTKVENTCKEIAKNKNEYCDDFGIICTITKINIYNVNEVENWAKKNNISVAYNIATIHKRLFNEDKYENFSVLTDEHAKSLATEWFYYKFRQNFSQKYYAIYRYLLDGKRLSYCDFKNNGLTLLPNGDISYCATYSKILGNGLQHDSDRLYYENQTYKEELIKSHCQSCSQYSGNLTLDGYLEYIDEILDSIGNPSKYKI